MERALRTKDAFLANMSHELRTPLSAILALGESMLEGVHGSLNPRQRESLQHIEQSGRHLLDLINDILDLSKVEAGHLDLQIQIVSIADSCRASLQFVREIALKKRLQLAFQITDELADIAADPKRLKQMLVNLLSNAVKFTPAGGKVSLEVIVHPEQRHVAFAVRDTGIGIAAADIVRLFQPFTQLDSSLSRHHEGTGLGLTLVSRLAQLHGGHISVESTEGKGSCFIIVLPLSHARRQEIGQPITSVRPAQPPTPSEHIRAQQRGSRVLLVEDNEVNLQSACDYLSEKGFQVALARNGYEALAQAAATHPQLILMDIQMPELDGLAAIRRLRADPDFAATPIIALTALAMAGDRERCLAAGANAYLTKPVRLKELYAAIQQLLSS
ncbi:MAG: response regulator [Oscillochloris sp.]|nr:response regulator [Oscillochloris sp.]